MIIVEKDGVSIPEYVLEKLCSLTEGYLIFYMGADGEPEYINGSSSAVYIRGLTSFAIEYFKEGKIALGVPDLPDFIISNLEEHTLGGFIMFYMRKDGEPDGIIRYDNTTIRRGMISFARDILNGQRVQESSEYLGFFQMPGFPGLPDETDDDD
jgi:hypothetical protein